MYDVISDPNRPVTRKQVPQAKGYSRQETFLEAHSLVHKMREMLEDHTGKLREDVDFKDVKDTVTAINSLIAMEERSKKALSHEKSFQVYQHVLLNTLNRLGKQFDKPFIETFDECLRDAVADPEEYLKLRLVA